MTSFSRRVLGIDPGSRQIGVAVFTSEELIFYGVKYFRAKHQTETFSKLQKVVANLIDSYGIEIVAIERTTFPQQDTAFVKDVYKCLVRCVKKYQLELIELDPQFVRKVICGNQKPTKRNTAQTLVRTYNELEPYFDVQQIWSRRYYGQLFDAIAVGLAYLRSVSSNTLKDKQPVRTDRPTK